jgi:PAS domain S-box-containing protein
VLRAKVAAFIHLFVQSRELQRSLESITALNGALRDSEVHTRAVLQNVADGIVTAGEAGLIESFNRSAQRLFGYKEFEVIGQPLRLVIAPNADDAASELATTEAVGRRKDGSCFPMEINTSLVNIGERMLTIGCIRDVSARNEQAERERERALRREAQRDRVAFEAAPIGGIITGRDGRIERVNQAMCEMTGYTADELIGTPSSELAHPDEREHSAGVIAALLSGMSETERFDKRYLHRDGRIIEARVALTTIRDEHDEIAQLFGQIEDITEARRTGRELEQAQFEMLARPSRSSTR